jgi:hypothetical protein
MVLFSAIDHRYTCGDERYDSVSSVFEPYKSFNKDTESFRMALKVTDPEMYADLAKKHGYKSGELVSTMLTIYDPSDVVEKQQEILAEWQDKGDESRTRGTRFHSVMEQRDIQNGGRVNPYTKEWFPLVDVRVPGHDNNSVHHLEDLEDGYYPELLLFNHDEKIAGQADMVFVKRPNVWVDDWKTDQKIDTKSLFTKRYGYTFLAPPLSHVHDTNFWMYALKISTYAWMLEQAGFEPTELGFTHVGGGEAGGDYLYRTPYLRKEVEAVLKERKIRQNAIF